MSDGTYPASLADSALSTPGSVALPATRPAGNTKCLETPSCRPLYCSGFLLEPVKNTVHIAGRLTDPITVVECHLDAPDPAGPVPCPATVLH